MRQLVLLRNRANDDRRQDRGNSTFSKTRVFYQLRVLLHGFRIQHLPAAHQNPYQKLRAHRHQKQASGIISVWYGGGRNTGSGKCHCFKKAIVDYLYTQSNLKDILDKENFSTCSLTYYSRNHIDPLTGRSSLESMETALNVCHNFVDTFSEEFHNILLYGDTGVGKTFLSHCIAKELMDSAYSVIYFTAAGLFDILAENTFGKRQNKDSDVFEHIYDCDLLIIDDLGTELPNSFTVSQLFICLNERILRQKSTIISTNLALDDIKTIYSERTFSRISSNYTILRITGDDIRIQKKLLNLGGTNDVTP